MAETILHNPDNSSATSPGAVLMRCREYHEITLEEAAETTKIGVSHLEALENDRIREFASPAHLKGFLRIYAVYLGLNPDDLMKLYERLYAPEKASASAGGATASTGEPRRKIRIPWQKLTLPAGLLLLILITSAVINRSQNPARQQAALPAPAAPPAVSVPVQPPRTSAGQLPPSAKKTSPPVPIEAATPEETRIDTPAAQTSEQEKGFILRMKVLGTGTLAVSIDGAAAQDYDLAAGDVIEWKAERNIALELSNAGSVEAELNGRTLKPFGPSGRPAYVVLGAEGIRQ